MWISYVGSYVSEKILLNWNWYILPNDLMAYIINYSKTYVKLLFVSWRTHRLVLDRARVRKCAEYTVNILNQFNFCFEM